MAAPEGESIVSQVLNQETSSRSRSGSGAVCFEVERDETDQRVRVPGDADAPITTSEPDARAYTDALPELPVPSSGELLEDCGEDVPALFCSGCGTPYEVGRTCRRSRCPRCWQSWAFQRAHSVASKVEALGRHLYSQEGKKVKQHHLTVSLRDTTRFNSKDPIGKATEAVKSLLQRVNVETGYIIYHPFRIVPEERGVVLGHESGDGDKTWKDILELIESEGRTWEEVRDEHLVYAPHFHVICLSEFVQCGAVTEQIEAETGAVIHRITTRRDDGKERSIDGLEELCKVTAYSLSHTGLAPESDEGRFRAAVRPFGRVANFEAWDGVKGETKATLRQVAPKVLGLEFPEPECSEHVHADDESADRDRGKGAAYLTATRHLGGGGGRSGLSDGPTAETWQAASSAYYNDDTSTWDATAGSVPSGVSTPSEEDLEKCGGQLVPMWACSSYLGNLEWLDAIEERYSDGEERLRKLRDAYEEWDEMGRPRPDVPPDD